MASVGGDLSTLAALKRTFDSAAQQSESVRSSVDSAVHSAVWEGPNANAFREAWASFQSVFPRLREELDKASMDVRNQHNNLAAAVGSAEQI